MDRLALLPWLVLAGVMLLAPTVRSLATISGVELAPNSKTIPVDLEYDDDYSLEIKSGNEIINSTLALNGHYREITISVSAFKETFVLDLQLNTHLFSCNYIEKSKTESEEIYHKFNHTEDHCLYIGKVRGSEDSVAAISTCNGISGYFSTDKISLHIESHGDDFSGPHKVFKIKDGVVINYSDGENDVPKGGSSYRMKRSTFNWPRDSDDLIRMIEVYFVVSYEEYVSLDKSESKAIETAKAIVNLASIRYQSLGIYLVIVGVEVWTSKELITFNLNDSVGLVMNFNEYRKTHINPLHNQDVAILLTASLFETNIAGKAPMSGMCSFSSAGMFATDIEKMLNYASEVMAHEMGHLLGFQHDTEDCGCEAVEGAHCIMWPSGNPSIPQTKWSQCSKTYLLEGFQHGAGSCLKNIPEVALDKDKSVCGNGIVEADEQCDCGNVEKELCNSDCCDKQTCRLITPATCASGKCCDTTSCQIKRKWIECRTNSGECDLPEFCDGVNPYCPENTYRPDGIECTNEVDAFCYKGQCNSHRSQCLLLWGDGAEESVSDCYEMTNTEGSLVGHGDCGIDYKMNETAKMCLASDMMCGRLYCVPGSPASQPSTFGLRRRFGFTFGSVACKMLGYDYGMGAMDPGLVPNGAKCDEGKMCVDQHCVDVKDIVQSPCSPGCSTNEVCNNLGKCQTTTTTL